MNVIPISEAVQYPEGTQFRLETIDERDAYYDMSDYVYAVFTKWHELSFLDHHSDMVYFNTSLPNTTFTLINHSA